MCEIQAQRVVEGTCTYFLKYYFLQLLMSLLEKQQIPLYSDNRVPYIHGKCIRSVYTVCFVGVQSILFQNSPNTSVFILFSALSHWRIFWTP